MLAYKIYEFVYVPYTFRTRKYPNLNMSEKFYPVIGDLARVVDNDRNKRFEFWHYIEDAINKKDIDLNLTQIGPD